MCVRTGWSVKEALCVLGQTGQSRRLCTVALCVSRYEFSAKVQAWTPGACCMKVLLSNGQKLSRPTVFP